MNSKGAEVPEVEWCKPGEIVALEKLKVYTRTSLMNYAADRNNPMKPEAVSGLSPYLHFGHVSAQRCALEARRFHKLYPQVCSVRNLILVISLEFFSDSVFGVK